MSYRNTASFRIKGTRIKGSVPFLQKITWRQRNSVPVRVWPQTSSIRPAPQLSGFSRGAEAVGALGEGGQPTLAQWRVLLESILGLKRGNPVARLEQPPHLGLADRKRGAFHLLRRILQRHK